MRFRPGVLLSGLLLAGCVAWAAYIVFLAPSPVRQVRHFFLEFARTDAQTEAEATKAADILLEEFFVQAPEPAVRLKLVQGLMLFGSDLGQEHLEFEKLAFTLAEKSEDRALVRINGFMTLTLPGGTRQTRALDQDIPLVPVILENGQWRILDFG